MMQPPAFVVTEQELQAINELTLDRKWIAATAIAIGLAVRLLKSDVKITPTIPARWRPWLAIGLGVAAGVLDAIGRGTNWRKAIGEGVVASVLAMVSHDLFISGLRNGRELGEKAPPPPPPPSAGVTVPRGTDDDDVPPPPAVAVAA